MQSRSQTPRSMLTSNKLLEPAASAGVRKLRVHRGSKKMRECRAHSFPGDHTIARRNNRFPASASRVSKRARVRRRAGRTRLILSDKLLRRPEQARSFADRNKTYI